MDTHAHSQSAGFGGDSTGPLPLDAAALSSDTSVDAGTLQTTMPDILTELSDAEVFLYQCTSTQGSFFIEIMAGECVLTLGVMPKNVPCLRPWDVLFDDRWDVPTQLNIPIELATRGRIDTRLATPCQSFAFTRKPALRDASCPLGKPGLSTHQQKLVEKGNELAAWTLTLVKAVHAADGYFTVENPYLS